MINFFKPIHKSIVSNTDSHSESEILTQIKELNDQIKELNEKVDCLQKSTAFLFRVLPDKIREVIMDCLNERNRRSFPY